jgi:EAL and modified HD-GYP domain-containing signal transduction protein
MMMSAESPLPLINLRPAVDAKNAWTALLLEGDGTFDEAALGRLLGEFALGGVLDALPCVVPVDPRLIEPAIAENLPPGRLVLRVPGAIAVDPAAGERLGALQEAGCTLMGEGYPEPGSTLFPGIHSLAVTCPGHAMPAACAGWLSRLPGPHLALGTTENICPGFCKFHWLAGHYAANLSPHWQGDPTARSLLLKLLALVMADADDDEIEALIRRDTNLSYHLLKLVNSVAFAPARKITSFGQAIAIIGRRQLQRWLQLLLYVRPQGSESASPLLPRAALRAALMEALAKRLGQSHAGQDQAFMTGMFSLLDILFAMPLAEIVGPLSLPEDVTRALVDGQGELGGLLAAVAAAEDAGLDELAHACAAAGVSNETWAAALCEAARWAAQISQEA